MAEGSPSELRKLRAGSAEGRQSRWPSRNADSAADVYALNFPDANLVRSDVADLFDGSLGTRPSASERKIARQVGEVDLLLAGPPCQGHSDLNNHTRRTDPRNALYLRAARAAEVLRPTFVVIENVPAVRHDKGQVVAVATAALEAVGYTVAQQSPRPRQVRRPAAPTPAHPPRLSWMTSSILRSSSTMRSPCDGHDERSVRWAIADLVE